MRYGARTLVLPSLGLIAAGLALFARVPVHGQYVSAVLPPMILLGTGAGLAFPALATLAMSESTGQDAGLASGLINATTQVGAAVGLAVLATLSATRTAGLARAGVAPEVTLTGGYRLGLVVGATLVVAAMIVAATVLPRRRRAEVPSAS